MSKSIISNEPECWMPIKGYEGLYEVSNMGNVRSLHPHSSKKVNPTLIVGDKVHGYRRVELHKKGKPRARVLVHRLVAKAFVPNQESKNEVNHIDGNKDNNAAKNLEWCTHRENMKHAAASGLVDTRKMVIARWGHA